jgi:hypothetical protein
VGSNPTLSARLTKHYHYGNIYLLKENKMTNPPFPEVPNPEFSGRSLVTTELYPDTVLNFQAEQDHLLQWQKTGECRKPTIIGTFTLNEQAADYLQTHLKNRWDIIGGKDIFSEDPVVAATVAHDEGVDPIPDENSRTILRQVNKEFEDFITADISRVSSKDPDALGKIRYQRTQFGIYENNGQGAKDLHSDQEGTNVIRYACAIVGPGTIFYTGKLPSEAFNDQGDSAQEPDDAIALPEPYPTGAIVCFRADADPHSLPEVDDAIVRVLLDASVSFDGTVLGTVLYGSH